MHGCPILISKSTTSEEVLALPPEPVLVMGQCFEFTDDDVVTVMEALQARGSCHVHFRSRRELGVYGLDNGLLLDDLGEIKYPELAGMGV